MEKINMDIEQLIKKGVGMAKAPEEGEDPYVTLEPGGDVGFILRAGQNIDFIYMGQDDENLYGFIAMPYGETNTSTQENLLVVRKSEISVIMKIYRKQLSKIDAELLEKRKADAKLASELKAKKAEAKAKAKLDKVNRKGKRIA
jgi:hypothetical protein